MKKSFIICMAIISLFLLLSSCASFSSGYHKSNNNNTQSNSRVQTQSAAETKSEPAKDPDITWNSVSLNGIDCEKYLRLSLDYNSGTITIQSKHKNKYEVFENVGINIQLVETSRAQYWAGFAKITLDSNGYGEFTSDKLKILCAYYGRTLGIQTSQCYIYGTYKYGS